MLKFWTGVVCVALVGFVSVSSEAQARPKYVGAFKAQYSDLAAKADEVKCGVCHYGEKKSNRNDYGMEVGKALGAKNVMEEDTIKAALKKAEAGKSATDGKTFGDLLKAGELPGKAPAN